MNIRLRRPVWAISGAAAAHAAVFRKSCRVKGVLGVRNTRRTIPGVWRPLPVILPETGGPVQAGGGAGAPGLPEQEECCGVQDPRNGEDWRKVEAVYDHANRQAREHAADTAHGAGESRDCGDGLAGNRSLSRPRKFVIQK